ncbi:MAG: hypothetical protein ACOCWW_00450, partial [Bacteroidota bacterium]
CYEEIYSEKYDNIVCINCGNKFTVDKGSLNPIGVFYECPHCYEEFYSEQTGTLTCPNCQDHFTGTAENNSFSNYRPPVDRFLDKVLKVFGV